MLSAKCFECHGPDSGQRKAGLRLDLRDGVLGSLRNGKPVVAPFDTAASGLIHRITATDPDDRMPPPESRHTLTAAEIDLLQQWVEEGATWQAHWAFVPPQRAALPSVTDEDWCRDAVDRHILARLEANTMAPGDEADKATLLRRLSFDLTGLPPTIEDQDAFLADTSDGALGRAVDRLLSSPAFGERMASQWLDLARYADTYGYQTDVGRSVWPYRDWVVRSFNDGLPWDDFITWQLAGDLLPNATRDQRLATTFNRLHRQTNEGGSVEEEFRVEYVSDRVHTFGTAMLGLTTECARCHDHKFDPISQREYYQLSAFFGNINESGLYSHFTSAVPTPTLELSTPSQAVEITALEAQVREDEAVLAALHSERHGAFEQWLSDRSQAQAPSPVLEISGLQGSYALDEIVDGTLANGATAEQPGGVADQPESVPGRFGGAIKLNGDNNIHFPGVGVFTRVDPFTLSLWINVPEHLDRAVVIHRSKSWTDAGSQGYELLLKDGRPAWSLIHFWPGDAISIQVREPLALNQWAHVAVSHDGSGRAAGLAVYIDGKKADVDVVQDALTRVITGGGPGHLTIGQRFRDRGFKGGSVDAVSVFSRALTAIEVRDLFETEHSVLQQAESDSPQVLYDYYLSVIDESTRTARTALHASRLALAQARDRVTEIMAMQETSQPRATYVLGRGRYDDRLEQVFPSTPEAVMPFGVDRDADRLGLASWVTDPSNPLTARVVVNRLWATVFGRGLVETMGDFGSQGSPPSHPELLDMLAVDFVESGWDVKAMLRRLVSTATYRQASGGTAALWRDDPSNALYARGPSYRLTAEMMRDQALAASGLLVDRLGGPSVHPYQPAGLWQEKSGMVYPQGQGEALFRRSLYTYWKRTSPPPSMMLFDAAKRDVCVARRASTSTPLQALVLLNGPQFVEASRVLAQRVLADGDASPGDQIRHAFRLLTSREPREEELLVLTSLHSRQQQLFAADEVAAQAVAGQGGEGELANAVEVASMASVCSTIMNADAALMRR